MSLINLNFKLGVAKDDTDYGLGGYAADSNNIRLSNGNVSSLGGCQLKNAYQMSGKARGMFEWATSDGQVYAAVGTHRRLYVHSAAYIQNITPVGSTGTLGANPFSTVSTSNVITVAHTLHGLHDGDWVYLGNSSTFNGVTPGGAHGNYAASPFTTMAGSNIVLVTHINHGMSSNDEVVISGASAVGGITPNGTFLIRVLSVNTFQIYFGTAATSSVVGGGTPAYIYRRGYEISFVDANSYTITDVATASGTGTGGGVAVQYLYELASGLENGISGSGYSTGPYSAGPYSVSFAGSTITFNPRTWSFSPYGDTLIANPAGGKIYEWTKNWSMRATQVANSPDQCLYVIVTSQRQIIALGCTSSSATFDAMQLRWSDIQDRTVWIADETNSAGGTKLTMGSNIVCASRGDNGSLIWTDMGFYNLTYVGDFGQSYRADLIAPNWGICGPNSFIDLGLEVYWVTPRGTFARYRGGIPQELRCRSKKWFNGMALGQMYKVYAFYDQKYPAVTWLFQMTGDDCDTYIRFDISEESQDGAGGWSVGTTNRTAWLDMNIMRYPLAVSDDGYLFEQENGNSDNGNAITRFIDFRQVAEWDDQMGQGDRVFNLNKIIPQVQVNSGSLGLFLDFRRFPNEAPVSKPSSGIPFPITSATTKISARGQGRSLGLRLISQSTNDDWNVSLPWKADLSGGARR